MARSEWTLADLATELQLKLELVSAARYLVGGYPVRRTAAGVPVFDRATVSRIHRLLVEKDTAVLFERRDSDAEFAAYFQRETGRKLVTVELLPAEEIPLDEPLG